MIVTLKYTQAFFNNLSYSKTPIIQTQIIPSSPPSQPVPTKTPQKELYLDYDQIQESGFDRPLPPKYNSRVYFLQEYPDLTGELSELQGKIDNVKQEITQIQGTQLEKIREVESSQQALKAVMEEQDFRNSEQRCINQKYALLECLRGQESCQDLMKEWLKCLS